ncbi:hypothetical protein ACFWBH_17555 [Streptomyces sp. NPDC059999]|uniref:hypothetical protein n=1 Tax=unclassified Streptomyces TaxID=2593676 RepID=UPI0036B69E6A
MSRTDHPRPRRRRPWPKVAGLLVLLALGGYLVVQYESTGGDGPPYCTARTSGAGGDDGSGQSYELSPEQAANASTIAAVGIAKGLPERAVTIALATAMQESALRNLDHGDRDSLGLFQQRPSQGWGTAAQIMDPVYSAGIFYDRLAEVKGYSRLPLTVAAQKVQLSGFPQAYAKHEPDAVVLTAAFGGEGSVDCGGPAPTAPGDPERVRTELTRIFGKQMRLDARAEPATAGESGPVGQSEVAVAPTRGTDEAERRRNRLVAQWAVAHARDMGIARVSYAPGSWVAGESDGRWRAKGGTGAGGGAGDAPAAGSDGVRIFLAR